MNANSLQNQLDWCIKTNKHLNALNSEMLYIKVRYEDMVENLRSTGYMSDLLPMIEFMNEDFGTEINNLVKYIQDEHIAYVQVQADATASTIEALLKH